jgi:hypothetical protein
MLLIVNGNYMKVYSRSQIQFYITVKTCYVGSPTEFPKTISK